MFECERPTCDYCPHSKFNWGTEEMMCTVNTRRVKHSNDSDPDDDSYMWETPEYFQEECV